MAGVSCLWQCLKYSAEVNERHADGQGGTDVLSWLVPSGRAVGRRLNFIAEFRGWYGLPLCRAAKRILRVHQACEVTLKMCVCVGNPTQWIQNLVHSSVICFWSMGKCLRAGFMLEGGGGENR